MAASLGERGRRLVVDELRAGVRIQSRSWVGKVRFSGFEVRVVPKLAGENLGLVRMLEYTFGYEALRPLRSRVELPPGGEDLFDLLALLFVRACEKLLRGGLLSDYREREETLQVVRGRLLADRQFLQHFGRVDRLECRHDEHTTDVVENRILAAALELVARRVRARAVQFPARRLQGLFSEVCSLRGFEPRQALREITYHRLNEAYWPAHELASLVFDGLGVRDLLATGRARCFAFLLDMNKLFEAFVAKWLRGVLGGLPVRISSQRGVGSVLWDADAGKGYAQVRPDVVVSAHGSTGRAIPMDAKYKQLDLKRVPTGDLYQGFLYAFAYATEPGPVLPTTFLLYPASEPSAQTRRLVVRDLERRAGAEVLVHGIHIPTALSSALDSRQHEARRRIRAEVSKRLRVDRAAA